MMHWEHESEPALWPEHDYESYGVYTVSCAEDAAHVKGLCASWASRDGGHLYMREGTSGDQD